MRPSSRFRVVVVGAGPRGIATAHALLSTGRPEHLDVVVVDPCPGGRVWRRDQDRNLLMNSRLRQATLFVDDSVCEDAEPGPTFAQWCADVAPGLHLDADAAAEVARLGPDDFASRALFGEYTRWALGWLEQRGLEVVRDEVVAVRPHGTAYDLTFASGRGDRAGAVVLAFGHVDSRPTEREQSWTGFARSTGLVHVPPGPASEADLDLLPAGGDVAVLGTGLNFYDVVARTTLSRGGRFDRDPDGRLVYVPSGAEPVLWVGSGRGVPYMARGTRPADQRLAFLTPARLSELRACGPLDLTRDVWPDVVREMRHAWHGATARRRGEPMDDDVVVPALAGLPHEGPDVLRWCAQHIPGPPLDLERLLDPLRDASDDEEVRRRLEHTLETWVESARREPVGPHTAIGERLALAKNAVRDLVAAGALSSASMTGDLLGWFRSVGGFVAAGPPLERVEQVLALLRAGVVRPAGRGARVRTDDGAGVFRLASDQLVERPVVAVVEARLPADDLRRTSSALVDQLVGDGVARLAVLDDDGVPRPTGGLDVTRGDDPRPCRVVDGSDVPRPTLFALGIPVQPLEWNIANLPLPGTGARTLVQARAIARQVHTTARASAPPTADPRRAAAR